MATHAACGASQPTESETQHGLNGGKTKHLGNGGKVVLYRNNVSCAFLSKPCVGMAWVRKRIFMQKDVESALAKEPELLPTWTRLVQKGDVPFVKILADGEDAEYQFRPRFRPSDSKTLRLFQ